MGRPRAFDESDAVRAAGDVFARRGYAGASVEELVRSTGVGRASLYGIFGSKDGLFRRSLDAALADLVASATMGERQPRTPDAAIDLILVALMELAPDDAALAAHIGRALRGAGLTPADLGGRLLARARLRPTDCRHQQTSTTQEHS